jgi:hypothetical protein
METAGVSVFTKLPAESALTAVAYKSLLPEPIHEHINS